MSEKNNTENIIEQIRKLLALAGNNPSEKEAISAALKAQAMMAKYNIELAQVQDESAEREEIVKESQVYDDGRNLTVWKTTLADIVAKNFRVRYYFSGVNIVFYGYKTDAAIASSVFRFLADAGDRQANAEYNQARKQGLKTRGLKPAFLAGFARGAAEVLEKQCLALMIVVPQEVKDSFDEMTKDWGKKHIARLPVGDHEMYERGRSAGRSAANSRSIEG